jgi:hypothetical protein
VLFRSFALSLEGTTNPGIPLTSANVNIQTVGNTGYWLIDAYFSGPRALNSNTLISASANHAWYMGAGTMQQFRLAGVGKGGQGWAVGNFLGRNYKMIGVRFNIPGGQHYGWIRVSVGKDARSFTLHDYAYNTVPNDPISSGEHLVPQLNGTVGSRVELAAADVPGSGGTFAAAPKVVGYYFDPVKGKKTAKATFKATLNGDGSIAFLDVKKKVRLYDAKELKNAYKIGMFCSTLLSRELPNQGMNFDLDVTLPDKTLVPDVAHLALRPPVIIAIGPLDPDNVSTIDGSWFGVKPPKVWVEYRVLNSKGGLQVKIVKLKVLKPYAYPNAKGKPNASCMDVDNGDSQIRVQFPAAWPDDFDTQSPGEHALVIDNGIGLVQQALP